MRKFLLFTLLFAVGLMANANQSDHAELPDDTIVADVAGRGNMDMWDLLHSFEASSSYQYGVASDGENIYTSAWSMSAGFQFAKYDLQGNFIETFDVTGCGYIRDLTYDGQYFYGCDNGSVIYCVDLANKVLVSQINTSCSQLRHCSYDPVNDGFWVGSWTDLFLVDRAGATVKTGPNPTSCSGSGYFTEEDGTPHLYMLGSNNYVYDYNINENTLSTSMVFNLSTTPGYDGSSSGGGAFIGEYNGKTAFFGDIQQTPNLIVIYDLTGDTPEPPQPVPGTYIYDFEDGTLQGWTNIDADGDGHIWLHSLNNESGYDYTGAGHNGSNGFVCSASFIDYVGALDADNYLVSPKKYFMADTSAMSFWVDYGNDDYPDFFGIYVSTADTPGADDFTMIWEGTAKNANVEKTNVRYANNREYNWREHTVDLSAYAGQEIWLAIRHTDNDNYEIWIDDITIVTGEVDNVHTVAADMFVAYPNPANEKLFVESQMIINIYEIYNAAGQMVNTQVVGAESFIIDLNELPAGVYIVKLTSEGLVQTKKFVKK